MGSVVQVNIDPHKPFIFPIGRRWLGELVTISGFCSRAMDVLWNVTGAIDYFIPKEAF